MVENNLTIVLVKSQDNNFSTFARLIIHRQNCQGIVLIHSEYDATIFVEIKCQEMENFSWPKISSGSLGYCKI